MSIHAGINMEFIRSEDKPFAAGVARAAEIGYKYVEPMVHNGRELLSEAGYFHSVSMDEEPFEIKDELDAHGEAGIAIAHQRRRRASPGSAAKRPRDHYRGRRYDPEVA